jgi:hypothetical protein
MVSISILASMVFGLETGELLAVLLFGGGGVVAVWWGSISFRDGFDIWSNDPVDAASVRNESGVVEVSGTAQSLNGTVTAPYSNEDCLAYTYARKERHEDHHHDEEDNTPDWRTVESGGDNVPFVVEDDSGRVAVDPEGADISMEDKDYSSRHRTKQIERRLDVGEAVHVFGHRLADGGGALADEQAYIGDGGEVNYRIADTTGGRAVMRLLAKGVGAMVFGVVFVGVAGYIAVGGM